MMTSILSRWTLWSAAAALAALVVVSTVASCGGDGGGAEGLPDDVVIITTPTDQRTRPPRRTPTPSAAPTPTPTPFTVCGNNPDPAAPAALQVEEPKAEQTVKVPFHVRGWGSNIGAQNAGVAVAIVNTKQEVKQVLDVPPQPRSFRIAPPGMTITDNTKPFGADIVIKDLKEPTQFCIWVYQETTAEGRPKGVVQVPVLVVP